MVSYIGRVRVALRLRVQGQVAGKLSSQHNGREGGAFCEVGKERGTDADRGSGVAMRASCGQIVRGGAEGWEDPGTGALRRAVERGGRITESGTIQNKAVVERG